MSTPTKRILFVAALWLGLLFPAAHSRGEEAAPVLAGEASSSGRPLVLAELVEEALRANPELKALEARLEALRYKIPQARSLPDPMFMFGYQNEGWERYSFGAEDAWWMYSVSQMFPFPGKLRLKGEMAERDYESARALYEDRRLMTAARAKELYYDLFLSHREIDILREKTGLFSMIEQAAMARYSSGMGLQQEVIMAQTERYMLIERQEMAAQKVEATEAMLNALLGRDAAHPVGIPTEPAGSAEPPPLEELLRRHIAYSPLLESRRRMVAAAEAGVEMARREYYPDFSLTGTVMNRGGDFEDMWSLSAAINIPVFYRTKQRQGLHEARASLEEAKRELEASRLMLSSRIRDDYSMARTSERLMKLYREALIPKTKQDFEAALAGYRTGRVEAITVIDRLKALLDIELLYWKQFAEREKAMARLEAISGRLGEAGEGAR